MAEARTALASALEEAGFGLVDDLLPVSELDRLRNEVDLLLSAVGPAGGVRNALGKSYLLRELAEAGSPAVMARTILGAGARPTKLTVFDKTPMANWKVPWHQDLSIAVAERREVVGFGPWSVKDGVPHVQPPLSVLEQVLAIRVHLDETSPSNGALRVLRGTHTLGRRAPSRIAALRQEIAETVCPVRAGGGMLMSPLLLHPSSQASAPRRRRVLHLEYSSLELPGGLKWA
jgi:hypothetical protein